MAKERRGGSKSSVRARRARRRRIRVLLFGGLALGLGGLVGGLAHLGMYGMPVASSSASPGALRSSPDPSTEVDAQERARDWSRSLLLKIQPVLDERRVSSALVSPLTGQVTVPELVTRGVGLVAILCADPVRGSWGEVAPGLCLFLELLGGLPELGDLRHVLDSLVEETRKAAGPAEKARLPGAVRTLAEAIQGPVEDRREIFAHRLLTLDEALSRMSGMNGDREFAMARLDVLLQCWMLAKRIQNPSGARDRRESRKRVLTLLPRCLPGKREGPGVPEDRSRVAWRARALLELVEESLGVGEETESSTPFAEGVMVSMVAGDRPDDQVIVEATESLVQSLLTFEEEAVDPADIDIWAEHLQRLRGKAGLLSRLKVGLTRLWMRKVLDRLEHDAQSVSLLQPWTAAKLIASGQSFLDTTSLIAREFPEQIVVEDWIAIYDTSDRGLTFLQTVANSHGQFLPPGARKGIKSFERKLEESQSTWSNEADPLRYLLASCLRLTIRGRVPQLLEPGPRVTGDQVMRLVAHLQAWASKEWIASPGGCGVRQRVLSLGRFLDAADPAKPQVEQAFNDRTGSSR